MLFRLGLATVLGGVLGIDRDLHRKPAGVRVLAMVCLGSAAITMASIAAMAVPSKTPVDGVLRTVQGVLSGIGFLGAGVIMRAPGKEQVHGITTASSIWISAILGMVFGLGQWELGLTSFVLACGVLVIGRRVEALVLKFAPSPDATSSSPVSQQD
ncbi:MgtC/SapB family protein [Schlesneria paludicola]|uniref:MgtC/SapB family protein n=1 Tax=Schlesneria paludicola TaxID=360056 RepID=UPI0007C4EA89|nr:MgtC/SapB family protein [Schlesneria paludicola]